MENAARICPVAPSHIADLIRIGDQTNLSPWSANSYLEEMKNLNSIMLRLVNNENEMIGFVVGRLVPCGDVETRTDAEIYNIAVVDEQQCKGNGQKLLTSFLTQCAQRSASYVWLEVRESNRKAINFYSKNGFKQVQSRPNFYENPREAALLMRLDMSDRKELLI